MKRPGTERALPVGAHDHVAGKPGAPFTLLEYGDFECPYSGQAYLVVKEVQRRLGPQLRFVFRNFPLGEKHPHALRAAEAAECAGAQGLFWPMHDLLFENQEALADDDLVSYAGQLALDVDRFSRWHLLERAHESRVREDSLGGTRSGVSGTPTFFIGLRRHQGPWDAGSLVAALEAERRRRRRVA